MEKFFRRSVFVSLLLVLMAGVINSCGTSRRGEPFNGPITLNADQHKGYVLFMQNCHKCHPGGEGGVAPPLNNVPLPGFLVKLRVRSKAFLLGLGRMPSFKSHEISREDLDLLVEYMKALRKHNEPVNGVDIRKVQN